jgi:catechol 2,3-dioxygenase-like lactoylglutathione lyase family enzyme
MGIEVVEIHHPGIRMDADPNATLDFYQGLLGLSVDPGRPTIPGVPGFWVNVGDVGQIHLMGGAQPSTLAKGPGQDPTHPHIALGVRDIVATKQELETRGVKFWSMTGINGPQAQQIFIHDPTGNMIELHQVDQCRCKVVSRVKR